MSFYHGQTVCLISLALALSPNRLSNHSLVRVGRRTHSNNNNNNNRITCDPCYAERNRMCVI